MLPDKFRQMYDTYLNDWMRAEEVLKVVERIKNETFIPSIKELRYASRRIVQAHLDHKNGVATDDDVTAHLTEAIENCRKARHDAIDSGINFIHQQLDTLVDSVGLPVLVRAFPRYAELRVLIKQMDERIVASRKNRIALDDEYESLKRDHLEDVVDLYHQLETSRDVITDIQKSQRRDFFIGVLVFGLIVGIVASSAVLIGDKRGYFDWVTSSAAVGKEK